MGSGYGIRIMSASLGGGSAVTNLYGLKIEDQAGGGSTYAIYTSLGDIHFGDGVEVGSPTGGNKGAGTINVSGDIYKNNSAYNNPDWRFEMAQQGFSLRKPLGWRERSLEEIEAYTKQWTHLPGLHRERPMGTFERQDWLLEKVEEIYLHLFSLDRRVAAAEGQLLRLAA